MKKSHLGLSIFMNVCKCTCEPLRPCSLNAGFMQESVKDLVCVERRCFRSLNILFPSLLIILLGLGGCWCSWNNNCKSHLGWEKMRKCRMESSTEFVKAIGVKRSSHFANLCFWFKEWASFIPQWLETSFFCSSSSCAQKSRELSIVSGTLTFSTIAKCNFQT